MTDWPTAEGRRADVKAVLIAAVVVARHRAVRHPAVHPASSCARATASSSATTARPRTTPSAARPTMGGAVIIGALAARLLRRRTWSPGTPPTVSGVLVLFLMTGLGLVGFLDDFIKICKQRSLGPARPGEAGRPDAGRASSSRCSRCSSRTSTVRTPASTARLVRARHRARPGLRGRCGVILFVIWAYLMIAGTSQRREPHRRPRRPGHRRLA